MSQPALDMKDILHQTAWYQSQGMVKLEVDGDRIIDRRFIARPLRRDPVKLVTSALRLADRRRTCQHHRRSVVILSGRVIFP